MITFEVLGNPVTQGSIRATVHKSTGRAIAIQDHRAPLMNWRASIAHAAQVAADGAFAERGVPVWVEVTFRLQRPKSAPKRVVRPTTKPDIDKLARASLDALTGVVFADDSQVVFLSLSKRFAPFGEAPGAKFQVTFGDMVTTL
ncbi:MAG: RusA family crossover junction endodeoxyribonuclease [Gemmatimonadaceae bacterium]|nr:RusA family crossover junction endodeoxyribonuclease [Gemmatimonadaceae bacterium]